MAIIELFRIFKQVPEIRVISCQAIAQDRLLQLVIQTLYRPYTDVSKPILYLSLTFPLVQSWSSGGLRGHQGVF
jgi:hypothetical protein